MKEHSTPFQNSRTSKIVFLLSIIVSGYWWLGQAINVYSFALVGVIFEIFLASSTFNVICTANNFYNIVAKRKRKHQISLCLFYTHRCYNYFDDVFR